MSLQSAIVRISKTVSGHTIHLFLYNQGLGKSKELISFDDIASKINSPQTLEKLVPTIELHVNQFIDVKLKEEIPLLSMFITGNTMDSIKKGIVKEFEDDRFDFSSDNKSLLEDAKDGSRQIILEALENSINKSKISKNEAAVAMMIALKNNGLGSSENKNGLIEDLKLIFPNKNQNNLLKKVLNFSQFFQEETQKLRMFTPSQTATKFVGISLKRVPPNYALENLDFTKMHEDGLDKNHAFKALSQEAGIANIEELITPKTNVSSSESTNLKNGQKHTKSCSESINSFAARSF